MTNTPVSYQQEKQTLKNVWFTMVVVSIVLLMAGFAAGYLVGFQVGQDIPTTVITDDNSVIGPEPDAYR